MGVGIEAGYGREKYPDRSRCKWARTFRGRGAASRAVFCHTGADDRTRFWRGDV